MIYKIKLWNEDETLVLSMSDVAFHLSIFISSYYVLYI